MPKIPWDLISAVLVAVLGSTWFANWMNNRSKYSNRAIVEEQREQKALIEGLDAKQDANVADSWRREILRFNTELKRGLSHDREDFNDIMGYIDKYENYCKDHPKYPNSRAVSAIKHIQQVYEECVAKNDFL